MMSTDREAVLELEVTGSMMLSDPKAVLELEVTGG